MLVTLIKSDRRAREKPCIRCGYSLRKIDSQHCPECGLSVWLSLNQNDGLDWSRPAWLRGMAWGLVLLALGQWIGFAGYASAIGHYVEVVEYKQQVLEKIKAAGKVEDAMDEAMLLTYIPAPPPRYGLVATWKALALGHLVACGAGLLLLAWKERRYPDKMEDVRLAGWIVAGVSGLAGVIVVLSLLTHASGGFWRGVAKMASIAVAVVTWAFLRQIAKRIPRTALARLCGWLLLAPLVGALSLISDGMFGDFLTAVLMAYLLGSPVLMVYFAWLLRRSAEEAERNWAKESAASE